MSDNDSERDGEEDDDDSDNDLEIVVEQSGTVDSTDATSGGTDDDNLWLWVQRMISEGICPTIAPKILAFLQHKEKFNKFKIELITVVCVGKHLKSHLL